MENPKALFDSRMEIDLNNLLNDKKLTKSKRKTLKEFDKFNKASGLTVATRRNYIAHLRSLAFSTKKDFKKINKKDLIDFFSKGIKRRHLNGKLIILKGERLSERTINSQKIIIRKFYKWLIGNNEEVPEMVSKKVLIIKKLPPEKTEILTIQETKKMIQRAESVRDRALISILYESATRAEELLTLTMRDLDFYQEDGQTREVKIFVGGKTGNRPIFLYSSIPHLAAYLNGHPFRNQPDKPLWISLSKKNYGQALSYISLWRAVKNLTKKCKIKKKVTPHVFRKSRITHLRAGIGGIALSDSEIKVFAGWTKNSNMLQIYDHVSGKDLQRRFRQRHGLAKKEKDLNGQNKCSRCDTINLVSCDFCSRCGLSLTKEARAKLESMRKKQSELIERGHDSLKGMMVEVFNELWERKKIR